MDFSTKQFCVLNPLAVLLFSSIIPTVRAAGTAGAAEGVDKAGFWLSFFLLVVVSSIESIMSIIWTRMRVTSDGVHPCESSYRVCGRELFVANISPQDASEFANGPIGGGVSFSTVNYVSQSGYGDGYDMISHEYAAVGMPGYNMAAYGRHTTQAATERGCSTCVGAYTRHANFDGSTTEVVVDAFGGLHLAVSLAIRRFNPTMSLQSPAGLFRNVKDLIWPSRDRKLGKSLEYAVHLLFGLLDVSIGIAGLALNPGSPQKLIENIKDPKAPITLENYSTLFLLYWWLGSLLLLGTIPLRSETRSIQMVGWPGLLAFSVAALANVVLFCLGCWKIDYARRHHSSWTPMLSYWIGGASAISFPLFGVEIFHVFGFVGMVFMLQGAFN